MPYLIVDRLPSMIIEDGGASCDVLEVFEKYQQRSETEELTLKLFDGAVEQKFFAHHMILHKDLRFQDAGTHWIFFAANDRVVTRTAIDSQIGLKYVGEHADGVYVGLVTGEFLDSHVNQERTGFSMDLEDQAEVHSEAIESAKDFLAEYIKEVRDLQKERAAKLIRSNPQFLTFREDLDSFVRDNLPLRMQNDEEIFVELSRQKLRRKRRLSTEISKMTQTEQGAQLTENVKRISQALNADKVGSLAEYVVRRKEILEILDSSIAYKDPDNRTYYREAIIHELICPLRSSSDQLEYDDHNLWILDDRLAFYTFFASDKPFKTFVEDSESRREPDIAVIFDRTLAFRREGSDEPVIIIEFKKPGRDDFDGNTNPVVQVLEYVELFRSGSAVKDGNGRVIKPISKDTRFICYVVADFTNSLKKVVRSSIANHQLADGLGYFGYSSGHNAYVEVLPYLKVLQDARIRNEAFFARLELL